jgi:hypothetical protein
MAARQCNSPLPHNRFERERAQNEVGAGLSARIYEREIVARGPVTWTKNEKEAEGDSNKGA